MARLIADMSTGRTRVTLEHIYPFEQALTAFGKD
jgi:hypothetical protein